MVAITDVAGYVRLGLGATAATTAVWSNSSTAVGNGTGHDQQLSCLASWNTYDSSAAAAVTSISSYYWVAEFVNGTFTYGTGDVVRTTQGIPVAVNFTPTATRYVSSHMSIQEPSLVYSTIHPEWLSATPSCNDSRACSLLYSSYFESLGVTVTSNASLPVITPPPSNSPKCPLGAYSPYSGCGPVSSVTNTCQITGQNVQVFYFPPASGNATNQTRVYSYAPGVTFTSPSVYLSFDRLEAVVTASQYFDVWTCVTCGASGCLTEWEPGLAGDVSSKLGTTTGALIALAPEAVSTYVWNYGTNADNAVQEIAHNGTEYFLYQGGNQVGGFEGMTAHSWDPRSLTRPALTDYYLNAGGAFGCNRLYQTECATMYPQEYRPLLSLPSAVSALVPHWSSCIPALYGVYDPPSALSKASTIKGPVDPAAPTTSAAGTTTVITPASPETTPNSPTPPPTAGPTEQTATSLAIGISAAQESRVIPKPSAQSIAVPVVSSNADPAPINSGTTESASSAAQPDPQPVSESPPEDSSSPSIVVDPTVAPVSAEASPNTDPPLSTSAAPVGAEGPLVSALSQTSHSVEAPAGDPSTSAAETETSGDISTLAAGTELAGDVSTFAAETETTDIGDHTETITYSTRYAMVGTHSMYVGGPLLTIYGATLTARPDGIATYDPAIDSPGATPTVGATTITAGGATHTISAASDGQYVVDGTTVSGDTTFVNSQGNTMTVQSSHLIVGSSTYALSDIGSDATSTQGSPDPGPGAMTLTAVDGVHTISALSNGGYVFDGSTVSVDATFVDKQGNTVTLQKSQIIIGSATQTLPAAEGDTPVTGSSPGAMTTLTAADGVHTVSAIAGGGYVFDGSTVSADATFVDKQGNTVTIHDSELIMGSTTHALPAAVGATPVTSLDPSAATILTAVDGVHTISALSGGGYVVDGTTMSSATTYTEADGQTVELGSSAIVIGSSTYSLPHIASNTAGATTSTSQTGEPLPTSGTSRVRLRIVWVFLGCSIVAALFALA